MLMLKFVRSLESTGKIFFNSTVQVILTQAKTTVEYSSIPQMRYLLLLLYISTITINGELPNKWLKANVAPIFKKGDNHVAENYGPVSFTSVFFKVMDQVFVSIYKITLINIISSQNLYMASAVIIHMKLNSSQQWRIFSNITTINNKCTEFILDFSKAFAKVSH